MHPRKPWVLQGNEGHFCNMISHLQMASKFFQVLTWVAEIEVLSKVLHCFLNYRNVLISHEKLRRGEQEDIFWEVIPASLHSRMASSSSYFTTEWRNKVILCFFLHNVCCIRWNLRLTGFQRGKARLKIILAAWRSFTTRRPGNLTALRVVTTQLKTIRII